ncbi:MAG TPA: CoA pyrophosphatase [Burkholderiales bacterium]|nr:CoA pyrophosphatase [Burkholderiales bacterium]
MRVQLIHERAEELDLDELRRRLGAAPLAAVYGDQGAQRDAAGLRPAAVLMPIVLRAGQWTMLFTRRTEHLRSHAGQISFPGGSAESGDAGPEATALRESQEELGLEPGRVELVGRLGEYCTRTGFRITPVVGVLLPPLALRPDAEEVEETFEVPLAFLLDARNYQRHSRLYEGELRTFFAIPYGDYYIWGATAGMLVNLHRQLARAGA